MKIINITLMWVILMSIILAFSSSSMFFMWMCLELNMMSFIPLMNPKSLMSINSAIMYFIIQALASSLYIFMISSFMINFEFSFNKISFMIMCSMLIKIGAAPFHVWFPQISEGMSMTSFYLLSTIQKMIPLYIMTIFPNHLMYLSILLSTFFGSIGGFNQLSFRKILAFSSIAHLAWMMSLIMLKNSMWMLYMMMYATIMIMIIQMMLQFNLNTFIQMNYLFSKNSLFFIILLLSLGGMPPTMGFFMKWLALKIITLNNMLLTMPLISSSLVNLYFYARISYPFFLKNFNFNKWNIKIFNKFSLYILLNLTFIFIMIPFL
uniref:NADH dehydrogenase subunit 2 n=1 Tax=Ornithodoros improvisus TaxID=2952141 RepID=UPI00286C02D6|nr:NADH dehydrogenase subunit 2 [Ornithodoros improvisus]WKW52627.1 NADH dehydrogenase subunit 2 [Ornithodoros improvisus]